MSDVLRIANANARAKLSPFGIKQNDRFSHMWIMGRTGVGKTTLMKTMALQDGQPGGSGFAVFDPHGDLVEDLKDQVDPSRLIYLDGAKADWRFNPIEQVQDVDPALVAANLVAAFRHIWEEDWGPRLEHLIRNVVLTLLDSPGAHIGDVPRLLSDKHYRASVVRDLSDEVVRSFWTDEFDGYSAKFRAVVIAPLQNKLGAFLTDSRLRSILATSESSIDIREAMNDGKILLVNLSKGRLGEGPSSLLGSLMVSRIAVEAFARGALDESDRQPFFLYLDEFHSFTTTMLGTMLSELRKYKVGMVLAHQYLGQIDRTVRDALIGNAGTMICFRLGAADAGLIARELAPTFSELDLLALPNFEMYLRLMIDARVSKPFSAQGQRPEECQFGTPRTIGSSPYLAPCARPYVTLDLPGP